MTPERIQLRRTKGWKKPPNTIVVARPSRWGNPYTIGKHGTAEWCVKTFGETLRGHWSPSNVEHLDDEAAKEIYRLHCDWRRRFGGSPWEMARSELRGRNIACWCPLDQPCHADVLLEIANGPLP